MKINTDFVHPNDAPELLKAHDAPFLITDLTLEVRAFENALVAPSAAGLDTAGVYVNEEALPQTFRHRMPITNTQSLPPPPRKVIAMKKWFLSVIFCRFEGTKLPTISNIFGFILMKDFRF